MKRLATLTLAVLLALGAHAQSQSGGTGGNQSTPTRIESPVQGTVRTWQEATRNRGQTTGADAPQAPRTSMPAGGTRNGSTVTLPNCTDPSAANFGGLGNCVYIPPPQIVVQNPPPPPPPPPPQTCQDRNATNFGGPLPCVYTLNICDLFPGTAECCNENPSHGSCERYRCEESGGRWTVGTNGTGFCDFGVCGMGFNWNPCGPGGRVEPIGGGYYNYRCHYPNGSTRDFICP